MSLPHHLARILVVTNTEKSWVAWAVSCEQWAVSSVIPSPRQADPCRCEYGEVAGGGVCCVGPLGGARG